MMKDARLSPGRCLVCSSPLVALDGAGSWACGRCCDDLLFDPRSGNVKAFGLGQRVVSGGIEAITPAGQRIVVSAPQRSWVAPVVFVVAGAFCAALVFAVVGPVWLGAMVGVVVFVFTLALAVGVYVWAAARRGTVLALDAGQGVVVVRKGGRPTLQVPLGAIQDVYVWRGAIRTGSTQSTVTQVMLSLAGRHVRLADVGSADQARAFAQRIAASSGIPWTGRVVQAHHDVEGSTGGARAPR